MARDASVTGNREERLTTWKEIAAFLGRDERTAKRWEATRSLPVRRVPGGRSTVFAYRHELEDWLAREPSTDEPIRDDARATTEIAKAPRRLIPIAIGALIVLLALALGVMRFAPRDRPGPAPALYARAVYLMNSRTRAGLEQAIADFSTLILQRPAYAPAYAGLAFSYNLMPEYGGMPPAQAFAQAKIAAEHAVRLDPDSVDGQRALGFAEFWGAHDVPAARRAFEAAIRLDPRDATARHWYGNVLTMVGDETSALKQFLEAERLDPVSTGVRVDHANCFVAFGRLGEARDLLHAIEISQPAYAPAQVVLGRLEMRSGNYRAALEAMSRAAILAGDASEASVAEAGRGGLSQGGVTGMRAAALARREALFSADRHSPYDLAVSLAPVDPGRALDLLEGLANADDPLVMAVRIDWRLEPLHGRARFAALLGRLGLPRIT